MVKGKLIVNNKSKLYITNQSKINIDGNFDLCNSTIIMQNTTLTASNLTINNSSLTLIESNLNIGDKAHFKNVVMSLSSTNLIGGTNFRLHFTKWDVRKGEIKTGNYFLWESKNGYSARYENKEGKLFIGDNTRIQADIVQKASILTIGSNSFVNQGTQISCLNNIAIGNYVMISYDCFIFDNNSHQTNYLQRRKEIDQGFPNGTLQLEEQHPDTKAVNIKDDVWIGVRSMILKGITIGQRSVVAANTTVHKDTDETTLVYGYPNQFKKIN
jgi:acetyltransferase-like isoleucine patch superfamily enzyme